MGLSSQRYSSSDSGCLTDLGFVVICPPHFHMLFASEMRSKEGYSLAVPALGIGIGPEVNLGPCAFRVAAISSDWVAMMYSGAGAREDT